MKHFLTMLLFTAMVSISLYAQKQEVVVDDFFETNEEGTLNRAVEDAISAGTLSNTVFKLKPYGVYVLDGSIVTPPGEVLEIVADFPGNTQETAPPMICWTPSTAPDKTYLMDIAGEVKMENVWILWASLDGTRFTSTIRVGDSASVSGGRCEFNNVIFDYVQQASSGAIQPYATNFVGIFKDCYFRNAVDDHFRYYSRAVSVPFSATGLHIDSISFENCTFANIGYVYMQEAAVYGDNVHFNHCTFYNVVMFTLESGWWWKMFVTNSLFVNTYMFGAIPINDGEGFGGTINIAPIDSGALGGGFGFEVPFTEQDRRILFANNNYYIEQWLVDWMKDNPYSADLRINRRDDEIPVPMPMINSDTKKFFDSTDTEGNKVFLYMNSANVDDSLDPGFINPPINIDSLKTFLWYKWWNNADIHWAWHASQYTNNGGQIWPLVEDLSYTNEELKTAAMGGFPLGDLRWWPDEHAAWKAQEDAEHNRIFTWLETGVDPEDPSDVSELPGAIPSVYTLAQNYPNPFNPATKIEYSIPRSGYVTLKVYNLLGQEVATIFEGAQIAGNYIASFDAAELTSGVYMYRLQSGDITITKKFVLMK